MKTRTELYTTEDCIEGSFLENFTDKVMVLEPSVLKEEYRKPQFQLFKATGGFGCDPEKIGRAVFGYFIEDKEQSRWDRGDFVGILKDELAQELEK